MRTLILELTILNKEDEESYADVCSELVVEDFIGYKPYRSIKVISDSAFPDNTEKDDSNDK